MSKTKFSVFLALCGSRVPTTTLRLHDSLEILSGMFMVTVYYNERTQIRPSKGKRYMKSSLGETTCIQPSVLLSKVIRDTLNSAHSDI